jgi:hypothetical protein
VADHEFVFALELSDEPYFDDMLTDVTGAVLAFVGYRGAAGEELRRVLHGALTAGASSGHSRCDVRFRAHSGELHISVVYTGGDEWRTTRRLP